MKKESPILYFFRLAITLGIFIFIALQYWSSTLIEQDLKILRARTEQYNEELQRLQRDVAKIMRNGGTHFSQISDASHTTVRPHIDPSLPNLLQEDPFYETTLPGMLGDNFKPHGVLHSAVLGKPQHLHPFSNWYNVATWVSQCNVTVARQLFGKYETLSPDMAIKMEERKNKQTGRIEFWVHLRDNVYWKPLHEGLFSESIALSPHFQRKHQVTAADFKFYFDAIMNPYMQESGAIAMKTLFQEIESFEVVDPLTFVVRWKHENIKEPDGTIVAKPKYVAKLLTGGLRPLASFVYQYFADGKKIIEEDADPNTYRTNSIWAQNFAQHWAKNIIVSCGAWTFEGISERQISFSRNPDHYFPLDVLVEGSEVQFKETPDAIWQEFKANHLDSYELRPDQLLDLADFLKSPQYAAQAKAGASINKLEFVARMYSYIGWNEAKPYFKDKKVRQALTMAIDRERIIRQNLNGLGIPITGTFYRYSSAYDPSIAPWPYDVQRARFLLEEAGWYDSDGDGVIDKEIDGKRVPFKFRLTYYTKSPTAKSIAEYISTALKDVGIVSTLNGVDISDLSASFDDKSFDALQLAWVLGTPPDDPRQIWSSEGAKQKGSSNAIGFDNKEIDEIINTLQYESDPEKRIALYHRFDAIIHEEQPYTFLDTPKTIFLYRDYLQGVFIPKERQDLIPGADVAQPNSSTFWLR